MAMLADRIGRIAVLTLSVSSLFISQALGMFVCWKWKTIPLRAIWAMGVPMLLGGGRSIAEAMVFTIIADVTTRSKRSVPRS